MSHVSLRMAALLAALPVVVVAQPHLPAAPPEACEATTGDARALLDRAARAVGLDREGVLHAHTADVVLQLHQSDRPYPPYFAYVQSVELWFDPATGVERAEGSFVFPGRGPSPSPITFRDADRFQVERGGTRQNADPMFGPARELNAWAVLRDWRAAGDAAVVAECTYHDFPRVVLERTTGHGPERLYLDPESALPVKLDREEGPAASRSIWGPTHVEFVYQTWIAVGDRSVPAASFRVVDGMVATSRTVGEAGVVARADAPEVAMAEDTPLPPSPFDAAPDTVRVADGVYLLVTPVYTEAAALIGDTVVVFDATTSGARAAHDRAWVERLFPGPHPVEVLVTDLAWPHVGGVREWVAAGATVVSHRVSEPFVRGLVERRWTREPDRLEARRGEVALQFVGVDGSMELADGRVRVTTIGGIGSEGALVAYLPETGFLWAGDHVQTVDGPSDYAAEVVAAVRREGWTPRTVAAQHLPLTPWQAVLDANPSP